MDEPLTQSVRLKEITAAVALIGEQTWIIAMEAEEHGAAARTPKAQDAIFRIAESHLRPRPSDRRERLLMNMRMSRTLRVLEGREK